MAGVFDAGKQATNSKQKLPIYASKFREMEKLTIRKRDRHVPESELIGGGGVSFLRNGKKKDEICRQRDLTKVWGNNVK